MDRVRPGTCNFRRSDDVVVGILERAVLASDVGIYEPELGSVVGETRGPDAAAIGGAAHVELACPGQWAGN